MICMNPTELEKSEPLLTGNPHPRPERGFWTKLNWSLDNWAAKRLTKREFDTMIDFERNAVKNGWRWLIGYLVVTTLYSVCISYAIPRFSFAAAMFTVQGAGMALASSYVGYLVASPRLQRTAGWWIGTNTSMGYGLLLGVVSMTLGVAVATLAARRSPIDVIEKLVASPQAMAAIGLVVLTVFTMTYAAKILTEHRIASFRRITELERAAHRTTEADLKLLQAQVEPHFLYNTLANLRYLVQTNSPQALRMTDHIIEYLRQSLPNFRSDSTSVANDMELVKSYLSIMEIRMGGQMQFSTDVTSEAAELPIAPLMLLTLVENAIKHGVGRSVTGGRIDVEAFVEDERLVLQVRDTGAGLDGKVSETIAKPKGGGVGLANIQERIKTLYGDDADFALEPNRPKGAVATLSMPLAALKNAHETVTPNA
jgi:signal transduction histidine kinase